MFSYLLYNFIMKNKFYTFINSKNTTNNIVMGVLSAIFFSAFIYMEHYLISIKLLNTIFAIVALASLLYMPKKAILISGFFIGIFWFYWIGYSFKYNGVGWMMPFITIGFGFIYMLFFGILTLTNKIYIRAILLFALSFFEPFDWNWLQIELLFIESYIGIFKYQLIFILIALTIPKYIKNHYKYLSILFIILSLNIIQPIQKENQLKIKLVQTNIPQEKKWLIESQQSIINTNIKEIQKAIKEKYDIVVLPESCFPLFMNQNIYIENILKKLSYHISIVVGALYTKQHKNYNVTYFFEDGKMQFAKKMVLVPFGEYIPLPKFAQKFINDYFFAGQADFIQAKKPTDFIIKGVKFRNAICYEATCQEIYNGDVDFVIAISNNGWFKPTIEPTIQNLLLRFYARKNGVTIYHSANWSGTGVIK